MRCWVAGLQPFAKAPAFWWRCPRTLAAVPCRRWSVRRNRLHWHGQWSAEGTQFESMCLIGDATNVPASKARSVAPFEADVIAQNLMSGIEGTATTSMTGTPTALLSRGLKRPRWSISAMPLNPCRALFPLLGVGPFELLGESHIN